MLSCVVWWKLSPTDFAKIYFRSKCSYSFYNDSPLDYRAELLVRSVTVVRILAALKQTCNAKDTRFEEKQDGGKFIQNPNKKVNEWFNDDLWMKILIMISLWAIKLTTKQTIKLSFSRLFCSDNELWRPSFEVCRFFEGGKTKKPQEKFFTFPSPPPFTRGSLSILHFSHSLPLKSPTIGLVQHWRPSNASQSHGLTQLTVCGHGKNSQRYLHKFPTIVLNSEPKM